MAPNTKKALLVIAAVAALIICFVVLRPSSPPQLTPAQLVQNANLATDKGKTKRKYDIVLKGAETPTLKSVGFLFQRASRRQPKLLDVLHALHKRLKSPCFPRRLVLLDATLQPEY